MNKGAVVCKKYRLQLWRIWDDKLQRHVYYVESNVLCYPSHDPTIRRCINFAKSGVMVDFMLKYLSTNFHRT